MRPPIDPLKIDIPMPIMTPRLRIDMVHPDYVERQIEAITESIDVFRPWFSWLTEPDALTVENRRKWLRDAQAAF